VSSIDSTIAQVRPGSQRRRGSDYAELLTRVRQAGLLELHPTYYTIKIAINAASSGAIAVAVCPEHEGSRASSGAT